MTNIITNDEYIPLGKPSYTGFFFQVSQTINRPELREKTDFKEYFSSVMMLEAEDIGHTRQIYSLFDILGDLGGVTEVIMLLFGFFLYPISEHSFSLQALKRLYKARTLDDTIFKKSEEELAEEKEFERKKQYEEAPPDGPSESFNIKNLK